MSPGPRISRRQFLRRTLLGGLLLGAGAVVGRHLTGYQLDPGLATRLRVLSPKEYLVLMAVCRRLLAPDEAGAPAPDEIGVGLNVDRYLGELDPSLVGQLQALLHLVEHGSSLRGRFTRLSPEAQDEILATWESSRLDVRRQGFQALKTLAVLGYYDDPRTFALLGYPGPLLPLER
ncbi:MAG TPA: gluconate 2-dehydrogenase subunit 3 family protein [Polyangia bacterium]|nr:gluconate 2-dehydrogenase subunit 3 family protein [Polyangia bacterium]